jgi:hypothetical protein
MLSIIICSVNPTFLDQVSKSIASTIGAPYELLVRDNRQAKKGLCEVYNDLASQARYDLLCFVHEDILFETMHWGSLLVRQFEGNPQTGVIGVAGSKYKSRTFSGWYTGQPGLDYLNIGHRDKGVDLELQVLSDAADPVQEVVCIDGVFMACRRSIWEKTRFNQEVLKGFHFYDLDFSLRAAAICKIFVNLGIEIFHLTTGGDFGENWARQAMLFHEKTSIQLPCYRDCAPVGSLEKAIAKQWLDFLKKEKITFATKIKWVGRQRLFRYLSLWYAMVKFFVYEPFGLHIIHDRLRK